MGKIRLDSEQTGNLPGIQIQSPKGVFAMIYIGHFIHATNQEQVEEADRRHGEFNLATDAPDAASALELFRRQILYYRQAPRFFRRASAASI